MSFPERFFFLTLLRRIFSRLNYSPRQREERFGIFCSLYVHTLHDERLWTPNVSVSL